MNRFFGWSFTFLFTCFAWVFFRATDLETAGRIISSMVDMDSLVVSQAFIDELSAVTHFAFTRHFEGTVTSLNNSEWALVCSAIALLLVTTTKNSWEIKERLTRPGTMLPWLTVLGTGLAGGIASMFLFGSSSRVFLYFNF